MPPCDRPRLTVDALLSRVEDAGLNASAPPEQRWLDGWLLRLCPGTAKRARCINAVADGRQPFEQRLQRALAVYRAHGLPPIMRLTPFSQPGHLDEMLADLGWRRFDDTRVLVRDLLSGPTLRRAAPSDASAPMAVTPLEFTDLIGALRGTPAPQRRAHARRLLAASVDHQGFVLRQGTTVLACGQMALEDDLVGLYDVFTAPAVRGRGLASHLCAWLLARAADQGARHAYLQVDAGNQAALAVYRRLGFTHGYDYHYRSPHDSQEVNAHLRLEGF